MLEQDATKAAKAMDAAVAKVKRIVIMSNDGKSDVIRQIEPVKYFSDLEAKGLTFFPGTKIAFMVSGSKKMVGSQEELLFAYEDLAGSASQVLHLDLHVVGRNVERRKRKYEDYSEDVPKRSGLWDRAETLRFKEGVNRCGWGKWKGTALTDVGVADVVKSRTVESVRTFSRSSAGLVFKSTQIPNRRAAYSDLAESVKHLSRGLQDIDKPENESELESEVEDDSEDGLSAEVITLSSFDGHPISPIQNLVQGNPKTTATESTNNQIREESEPENRVENDSFSSGIPDNSFHGPPVALTHNRSTDPKENAAG